MATSRFKLPRMKTHTRRGDQWPTELVGDSHKIVYRDGMYVLYARTGSSFVPWEEVGDYKSAVSAMQEAARREGKVVVRKNASPSDDPYFGDIELEDGELKALLRAKNEKQFNHLDALPFLHQLEEKGLLKNDAKFGHRPWWIVTKRGNEVLDLYFRLPASERSAFQARTHSMFWGG